MAENRAMTGESQPALTRAEWTNVREQLARDPGQRRMLIDFAASVRRFDAAAAIALHEQPYGLRREWARALAVAVQRLLDGPRERPITEAERETAIALAEVADWLRALMPPEETNG